VPRKRIRPIALALIEDRGRILVSRGIDEVKQEEFFRPLGGGIEFGEPGEAAIVREIREELGADLVEVSYAGTLENIFVFNGDPGHELIMIYRGRLADPSLYSQTRVMAHEGSRPFEAEWLQVDEVRRAGLRLYPPGLVELL
jgi:8-oxo-dGTP pyrophosphatase MutT (NUDIX family)